MRIASSLAGINVWNNQKKNNRNLKVSSERLSAGKRINRASDDAAGLAISQKMHAQIRGLNQASRNAQDGISLIQTAEGAIGSLQTITQRMRELCVQGANGTLVDADREQIQKELDSLREEMTSIVDKTSFNTKKLLDGSLASGPIEKTVATTTTTNTTSIVDKNINVQELPNLTIPVNGSAVSTSVMVEGIQIDFVLSKNASGELSAIGESSALTIGSDSYSTSVVPEIEWEKNIGGSGIDSAESIVQTADGGYIVAGYSESNDFDISGNNGNYDFMVVKLDSDGLIDWQKSLGGTDDDRAYSIQSVPIGGYVVAGYSASNEGDVSSNNGSRDYWITRLDVSGNILWEKNYGGSFLDEAYSVKVTNDGGFIVTGDGTSADGDITSNHSVGSGDYWVTKLDSNGDLEWEKSFGSDKWDTAYDVVQTNDNGYIIVGESQEASGDVSTFYGSEDLWVVKLDVNGNMLWEESIGSTMADGGYSVSATDDGGFIVAGKSGANDGNVVGNQGNDDAIVIKYDAAGNMEWQENYGGSMQDIAVSINQTSDGGYIVGATTTSYDGDVTKTTSNIDFWTFKIDSTGNLEWQKSLGSNGWDLAKEIQQTSDGGYVVTGISSAASGMVSGNNGDDDAWVVKLSPENTLTNTHSIVLNDIVSGDDTLEFTSVNFVFDNDSLGTLNEINISAVFHELVTSTVETTTYSTITVEDGAALKLQVGANAGQQMSVTIEDMHPEQIGFSTGFPSVNPIENAGVSIGLSDEALKILSTQRSKLGAMQNALEHTITNVENTSENLQVAESRISDSDMAKEMMEFTKQNILKDVTNAMMVQSNQMQSSVLELLK